MMLRSVFSKIVVIAAVVMMLIASVSHKFSHILTGALLIGLSGLCAWIEWRTQNAENRRKPITTVEAQVVSHHRERVHIGRNHSVMHYFVTFKTADDQVLEFRISEIDYDDFDVGETGPLRYREWQFLSFGVKDKSHIKPIAPLPEEYESTPETVSASSKLCSKWSALRTKIGDTVVEKKAEIDVTDNSILTHELDE